MVSDTFYFIVDDTVFCPKDDKPYCPLTFTLFKLLCGEIYLVVSWYTFVFFILHIHHILHFCVPRPKFLEPKWSQVYSENT